MPGPRRRSLLDQLTAARPDLPDPAAAITAGLVMVDGRFLTNPAAQVSVGCSLVVRDPAPLRGSAKLEAALTAFGLSVAGRCCLDAGAAAGGFTKVLLDHGARRVYAVDAGHGQLIGSLRQDPRVVNLEGTNLGALSPALVPEPVEVITFDLSYLSLCEAVPQLEGRVRLAADVDLVGLVKPMFELRLAQAPTDLAAVQTALDQVRSGFDSAGWRVVASMPSPVAGAHGAREGLVHARQADG